jgi:alkylation response protein AidB-like acyl-CoA dehydrogenase
VSAANWAVNWLEPLLPAFPGLTSLDAAALCRFEEELGGLLNYWPVAVADPEERSRNLLEVRCALARSGHLAVAVPARDGGRGHPATVQVLLQFICGYHDVNLRDSTGLGHGRLIAAHASPRVRDRWLPRLLAGAVPGIAVTEPHGGSQVHATATHATPAADGTWRVSGTKTWISRLTEAAVFCAFFTAPDGQLTAAAIDARSDGLSRKLITPAGLSGWSWGELRLDSVTVRPCDILGQPGEGMALLRDHFACYRPLVTATALGAAAAIHNQTAGLLASRRQAGVIARVRDNALITLGRTWAQLNAALLAAVTAHQIAQAGHPAAQAWGCGTKAYGVDAAYQSASELALLAGAAGFTADSRTAVTRADLNALLYADGIHDTLYRTAGRDITSLVRTTTANTPMPQVPAMRQEKIEAVAPPDISRGPLPRNREAQAAGLPFSSAATVPAATASRHDATRRASNGVTSPATSSPATNAKPASSPSASPISLISVSDRTPPS